MTDIGRRPVSLKQTISEIPPLLVSPVAQRAGPATGAGLHGPQLDLAPPVQGVADELPAEEICRREDGTTRKIFERRGAQEICRGRVAAGRDNANGGVRVEAAQYGVDNGERVRGPG